MKSLLLFASLLLASWLLPAQTYTTVGDVFNPIGTCFCLNQNGNTASAVWLDNGITLDFASGPLLFDETFEVYLGNTDGGGHGISMTLQQESPTAIGDGGAALGYGGAPGISPAIHFEIDTHFDAHMGDDGTAGADHIAITTNGAYNVPPVLAGPLAIPNIEDGQYHKVRVILFYNDVAPATSSVTLTIDDTYTLSVNLDPTTIFVSNQPLYYGFTGGIDNAIFNEHKVSFAAPGDPNACSAFTFPVELIDFRATPGPNLSVALGWSTASEQNNAYFEVQRSRDGRLWNAVGEVKGAGTTSVRQDYTFTDVQPRPGQNFYRLRQVDLDGSFSLSPVVEVYAAFEGRYQLSLWPNPAREATTLRIERIAGRRDLLVEVVDVAGRRYLHQRLPVADQTTQEVRLDLHTLAPGLYWVRAGDLDGMVSTPLHITR